MKRLKELIKTNEDWLMDRVLAYAKERGYTNYTSTLKEAWRLSISGLSQSILAVIDRNLADLELGPEENYTKDEAAAFGIIEAKRHRQRGIRLDMFLGLMKYYRQAYADLIRQADFNAEHEEYCQAILRRFFDRVEIGFCTEWASAAESSKVIELQTTNRLMTNQKNKYLTIFESIANPVILLDKEQRVENLNHAAALMLDSASVSGSKYYHLKHEENRHDTPEPIKISVQSLFPWLVPEIEAFTKSEARQSHLEKEVMIDERWCVYSVQLSHMLDISDKFPGILIILEDITERKLMDEQLIILATTDPLTGAYNRRHFFEMTERVIKLHRRYSHPLTMLMIDIDRFKAINDTLGHYIGDESIKALVAECSVKLRETDLFGRLGGEEFGALLMETDSEKAMEVAERLRRSIAENSLLVNNSLVKFTVSIGIGAMQPEDTGLIDRMKRADLALYEAKRLGRNRTVLWDLDTPESSLRITY